ncbi:MAG: hypothetical protein VB108_10280 [Anaerolineaceae bacterium]|nr:hypothetical protein [Anaerolineaceae bacterium]
MGTNLQAGIDAAKSGRMEEALQLLRRSAEENPDHADVWVWLSAIIDDEEKQTEFLQKALEIDPENKPAQRGMAFLKRKKIIAPKPGETLSDHTRPIGVFKTEEKKPLIHEPLVPLIPLDEQQNQVPSLEEQAAYNTDTEATIPPQEPEAEDFSDQDIEETPEAEAPADEAEESAEGQLQEKTANSGDSEESRSSEKEILEEEAAPQEPENLAEQVTQVSAVLPMPQKEQVETPKASQDDALLEQEESERSIDEESAEKSVTEPEKQQKGEHPLLAEAKRFKWQFLLYGLILTAFVIIGILVGFTILKLKSPNSTTLRLNMEPIAQQTGVFILDGQEFRRLNLLQEFPQENAGLISVKADSPQVILKDKMVTDSTKLKLVDSNKQILPSQVKQAEGKIPLLEPTNNLQAGRYCLSYQLGNNESQTLYWCYIKE